MTQKSGSLARPDEPTRSLRQWLAIALIVAAGFIAYGSSFRGQFLFDDYNAIVDNPSVRSFSPIWKPLWPPANTTMAGRPVVNLSIALNRTIGGLHVAGYHAVNSALHVLVALALYGVVRRTLRLPRLAGRFERDAGALALAVALVWVVHPLLTEPVTYVSTRTELMVGVFFLLTLYSVIRSIESPRPRRWWAAATLACLLGAGSKEVIVAAPFVVLVYDRLFVAGSYRKALGARKGLYAGLAAALVVLALLQLNAPRGESVRFDAVDCGPIDYARTQLGIIVHYLRLAVWPSPLVLDYQDWPIASSFGPRVFLPGLVVGALLAGTIWGLVRGAPAAFLGVWFFLILAPTSSIIPITTEVAAERRMYLPLAAVVVLIVLAGHRIWRFTCERFGLGTGLRRGLAIFPVAVLALVLGALTWDRNRDYHDEAAIWRDTAAKRPANYRAHNNLGVALTRTGKHGEAIDAFREAVRLHPRYGDAYMNLGAALADTDRLTEAIDAHRKAIELSPDDALAHFNCGNALMREGRDLNAAAREFRTAIDLEPTLAPAHGNLALVLVRLGDNEGAERHLQFAMKLGPEDPRGYVTLAEIRAGQGRVDEAIELCRTATKIAPRDARARQTLAVLLANAGRADEAIAELQAWADGRPDDGQARIALGRALQIQGAHDRAITAYEEALRLRPDDANLHALMAGALVASGKSARALPHYRDALRLRPGTVDVVVQLAWILATHPDATLRDPVESVKLAELAASRMNASAAVLDVLAASYAASGRFDDAVREAERAAGAARATTGEAFARAIEGRLELYRVGRPFLDPTLK